MGKSSVQIDYMPCRSTVQGDFVQTTGDAYQQKTSSNSPKAPSLFPRTCLAEIRSNDGDAPGSED